MASVTAAGTAGRLPDPSLWQNRRVLLTGHTGFKGSWLALWLERMGARVSGVSLAPDPGSLGHEIDGERRFASERVDIRDLPRLRTAVAAAGPEIVIHMAAQALVRRSYADPVGTFATNVMGTAHLLEAVREAPDVRAVVVVTTDKCYENREWAYPYRESDALGGHDPYSASKAGSELAVASWRRAFLADSGVMVASARAGNVIGGGDSSPDRLVPDCLRAFARGEVVRIRSKHATRPWQHVLDPLCGYLLLAEALLRGPDAARAWNFGPGAESVASVGDVVAALAQAWGEGADWSADDGRHPHEAGLLAVESALARRDLHWRPRLDLADAIAWTIQWHKRHRAGEDAVALTVGQIEAYVREQT